MSKEGTTHLEEYFASLSGDADPVTRERVRRGINNPASPFFVIARGVQEMARREIHVIRVLNMMSDTTKDLHNIDPIHNEHNDGEDADAHST